MGLVFTTCPFPLGEATVTLAVFSMFLFWIPLFSSPCESCTVCWATYHHDPSWAQGPILSSHQGLNNNNQRALGPSTAQTSSPITQAIPVFVSICVTNLCTNCCSPPVKIYLVKRLLPKVGACPLVLSAEHSLPSHCRQEEDSSQAGCLRSLSPLLRRCYSECCLCPMNECPAGCPTGTSA